MFPTSCQNYLSYLAHCALNAVQVFAFLTSSFFGLGHCAYVSFFFVSLVPSTVAGAVPASVGLEAPTWGIRSTI